MIMQEDKILQLMYGSGGVLCTVIVVFWRIFAARASKTESALDECHKQHLAASIEMAAIKAEVAFIKGHQEGVEQLSADVLEAVQAAAQKPCVLLEEVHGIKAHMAAEG
jgi:hypothetical protein